MAKRRNRCYWVIVRFIKRIVYDYLKSRNRVDVIPRNHKTLQDRTKKSCKQLQWSRYRYIDSKQRFRGTESIPYSMNYILLYKRFSPNLFWGKRKFEIYLKESLVSNKRVSQYVYRYKILEINNQCSTSQQVEHRSSVPCSWDEQDLGGEL